MTDAADIATPISEEEKDSSVPHPPSSAVSLGSGGSGNNEVDTDLLQDAKETIEGIVGDVVPSALPETSEILPPAAAAAADEIVLSSSSMSEPVVDTKKETEPDSKAEAETAENEEEATAENEEETEAVIAKKETETGVTETVPTTQEEHTTTPPAHPPASSCSLGKGSMMPPVLTPSTEASGDADDLMEGEAEEVTPIKEQNTSSVPAEDNNLNNNNNNVSSTDSDLTPAEVEERPNNNTGGHHTQHTQHTEGVFPLWTRMTQHLHEWITKFVVFLSVHAAQHPYSVVIAVILLSLALVGVGFFTNFELNVDETEIFSPFNSIPQDHMDWRDNRVAFLQATRVTTFVVHADGENVLGYEPMNRVFAVLDTIRNIPGYHDICEDGDYYDEWKEEFTCRIISATRFWYHDTQLFYEQAQTDSDVIEALSATEYPGGVPTDHEYVLGNVERQGNTTDGTLTYAPAYFVYVLLSNKNETMDFEIKAIEELGALQKAWDAEDDNILQLEFFAERSFSDEFTRAIEEDMYLVPLIFIMMAGFTCMVFFKTDRVQSRCALGIGSVTTIGMSLMSGFGLMFIIGVPYTTMTTMLPFVVFGVGLDDTFIITGAYMRTDPNLDTVERIRLTMGQVGSSISVTTITTITAFILGLTSSVPSIYWLCLYAFPTIFIDFVYQITFFVAILVLDERRIKANREDLLICFVREEIEVDKIRSDDGVDSDTEDIAISDEGTDVPEKHFADRIMGWYAHQLMRPVVKSVVIVVFTYFFALCVYRTTLLTQEFDWTELFPQGSYAVDVLDAIQVYQERSLQVEVYFRDVNQSDPVIQEQMRQFIDEIAALPPFGQPPPLCWVRDFQLLEESEYYPDAAEEMTFEQRVEYALSIPAVKEAYGLDIVHENGNITASRCIIVMRNKYLDAVDDQISVLMDQREVTDAQSINFGRPPGEEAFFTFNRIYLMWEFYNIAVAELITTTVASVVAVSIVALIFIPHWSALLFIVPMVSIVYIDLLGTMQVAGLHINAVTYVCLVISIGLIVDFLMHILLRYHESTYKTREGKVKDTLETMGASILLGGLSTFLGVIPLAFSTSTILRTVFTSLFSMVILGVTHGLILLPVVLSVLGPAEYRRDMSTRRERGSSIYGSLKDEVNSTFETIGSNDMCNKGGVNSTFETIGSSDMCNKGGFGNGEKPQSAKSITVEA